MSFFNNKQGVDDKALSNQIGNWSDPTGFPDWVPSNAKSAVMDLRKWLDQRAINVRQPPYNAKGDGTDETSLITNILNDAGTTGRQVILPFGSNFGLSSLISIIGKSNIIIVGHGAKFTCSSSYGDVLKFSNGNNIHVLGLEIAGGETNVGSRNNDASALITFNNCTNVSAVKCKVYNSNANGISGIDCTTALFLNNDIYNVNLHPIWTLRGDTIRVEWNRLTGIRNANGTIPVGTSSEVARGGIGYLGTKGNNIFVYKNIIKGMTDTGTKTEGSSNVTYEDNYIEDSGKDGLKVMDYHAEPGWYAGSPSTRVKNAKIINNTVVNTYAWRDDGSALILADNVINLEIDGNIVHGGVKPSSVTDLNGIVKTCEENAVRVIYSENVIVDGHIEGTSTLTDSFYFSNNKNLKLLNCQFKKYGRLIDHSGKDYIVNSDIGNNPNDLNNTSALLVINPAYLTINNNRIDGMISVQPSVNTKSVKVINGNEITQYGTGDVINITNYTSSNASVENLEINGNTIKVRATLTNGRVIRVSCDKTAYTFVKSMNNYIDINGQNLTPLAILSDASGNGFKIQTLQTGQNYPAYVINSSDVVTHISTELWNKITDSSTITSTTPITSYVLGKYSFADILTSNTDLANFPEGASGTLVTYRSSTGDLWSYQEYHLRNFNRIYRRVWDNTNNVWLPWSLMMPYKKTATLDFPSIPAYSTAEMNIFMTGATIGDSVYATPGDSTSAGVPIENGLMWSAYVRATNFITVRLANVTATAIDPVSRTWKVDWSK